MLLVVGGPACTQLLGIDGSIPDIDNDGIPDSVDNCRFDYNPHQRDSGGSPLGDVCDCTTSGMDVDGDGTDDACDDCLGSPTGVDSGGDGIDDGCEACAAAVGMDRDGDGVDDACDACADGPDHDEDGDLVPDLCDNCPAQSNPDQMVAPEGSLGAACAAGMKTQLVFDPFVEQDVTLWPGLAIGWSWVDDGVKIDTALARTLQKPVSRPFVAEARVSTMLSITLELRSGGTYAACKLDAGLREISIDVVTSSQTGNQSTAVLPPGTGPWRVRLRSSFTGSACELLDGAGGILAAAEVAESEQLSRFRILSTGPGRLEYLWVVGE